MRSIIDKRDRARLLRSRMAQAMTQAGLSQTELARRIRVDRSTISQLLKDDGARLPNAHLVGACAEALDVSCDWLLGLSDRPESAAVLLASQMTVSQAPRALIDEQIFDWHREAEGYKIRHVPAGLPDMLKTRAVLEWEYGPHLGRTTEQAINAASDRIEWMRVSRSDYEIAMPLHELDSFTRGEGYYSGLSRDVRKAQLGHMLDLAEGLYPRLRMHLFDARRLYSAPITLFGPLLAVIYIGQNYLAFRDTGRIGMFTGHFDHLVKEAGVGSRAVPEHIAALSRML
ncbi:helix-turn-helix domain-containing protein [Tropicibacter sp. S64]|uniref:helix-turn-helix domain-containing protein n=1 Tax=Tropicibacter sp. S64 TaxID=3415122 RepID=UPI003C7ADBD7